MTQILLYFAGIQEGTECTKCKNDWALRAAIALLYVLCALLTIAVAVLGYKGESILKVKKKKFLEIKIFPFLLCALLTMCSRSQSKWFDESQMIVSLTTE